MKFQNKIKRLGEMIDLFDNLRIPLSSSERSNRQGPYPYYGAQGIIDYIDDFKFNGRYILIPEDGANLLTRNLPIAFFADGKFWVNNHAHVIRGKKGIVNDFFLKDYFNSLDISGYITGTAQPKLSQNNLKAIKVSFPAYHIQCKIAAILSAYDDLIENNTRRIKILEEMAHAIYREWFVNFRFPGHEGVRMVESELGLIPEGWEVKRMDEVAEVTDCLHSKKPLEVTNDVEKFGILLHVWNIGEEGKLDLTKKFFVTKEVYQFWIKRIEVKKGDCVITNVGRIGAIAQIPFDLKAAIGRNMTAIRCRENFITPTFLIEYLRSPHFEREKTLKQDLGTIMGSLNVKGIITLNVITPPFDITQEFENNVRPIRYRIEIFQKQIDNLRRTRDLLLPKLISGELDVSELDIMIPEAMT